MLPFQSLKQYIFLNFVDTKVEVLISLQKAGRIGVDLKWAFGPIQGLPANFPQLKYSFFCIGIKHQIIEGARKRKDVFKM